MTEQARDIAFWFHPGNGVVQTPVAGFEEGDTAIIETKDGPVQVTFGPRIREVATDAGLEIRQGFKVTPRAPGTPDPALIVGDWTGEIASRQEREALAYREMLRRLRSLYVSLSKLRASWANSDRDCAAARAVAYQTSMSRIGAIIEDVEKLAAGS